MSIVQTILDDVGKVIDVFGATAPTATEGASKVVGKITLGDVRGAFQIAKALPYAKLAALVEGKATVDDAFDVTEEIIGDIATFFPGSIPEVAAIEMGLKGVNVVFDFARAHGVPSAPGDWRPGYINGQIVGR